MADRFDTDAMTLIARRSAWAEVDQKEAVLLGALTALFRIYCSEGRFDDVIEVGKVILELTNSKIVRQVVHEYEAKKEKKDRRRIREKP